MYLCVVSSIHKIYYVSKYIRFLFYLLLFKENYYVRPGLDNWQSEKQVKDVMTKRNCTNIKVPAQ